jgi:hypothetical protein
VIRARRWARLLGREVAGHAAEPPGTSDGADTAAPAVPQRKPADALRRRSDAQGDSPLLLRELMLGPDGVVRDPKAVTGFTKVLWNVVLAVAFLILVVTWATDLEVDLDALADQAVGALTTRFGLAGAAVAASGTIYGVVRRRRRRR